MVLSGVVPELFYFNFLGAWFTHSPWFGLGVTLVLWVINTIVAVHRNDEIGTVEGGPASLATPLFVAESTADLIITLNFRVTVASVVGTVVGLTVAWAFQLPPLLDPQLWHVRKRLSAILPQPPPFGDFAQAPELTSPVWAFNFSFPRFAVGGVTAGIGANFLIGFFQPEVSPGTSTVIGVSLLAFGLALAIYTLIRWYKSDQPSDWLNFGYALALVFLMILPAIYDYGLEIRPNQGWLFQLGLAIVVIVIALLSVRFFKKLEPAARADLAQRDPRYSPDETTTSRIWGRWLSLWLPLAIIYLVGWLRDEMTAQPVPGQPDKPTQGDVTQVLLAISLTAIVLEALFLLWGFFRWRTDKRVVQWITDEDLLDDGDYIVVSRQSPSGQMLLTGSHLAAAASGGQLISGAGVHTAGLTHRGASSALDALKLK